MGKNDIISEDSRNKKMRYEDRVYLHQKQLEEAYKNKQTRYIK